MGSLEADGVSYRAILPQASPTASPDDDAAYSLYSSGTAAMEDAL